MGFTTQELARKISTGQGNSLNMPPPRLTKWTGKRVAAKQSGACYRASTRFQEIHRSCRQLAIALACGVPPMLEGGISSKLQLGILAQVAEEMADGFRAGIDRIGNGSPDATRQALSSFLAHVQASCDVPTALARATEAFYLPSDDLVLETPPAWWMTLTVECWSELLSEDTPETASELSIACTNAILPAGRGMPAVVWGEVELSISFGSGEARPPITALLTGGSHGRVPTPIQVDGTVSINDTPLASGQRSAIIYKVESAGCKPATARIVSLASWTPGILVTCRIASKLSLPKKPRKTNAGTDWESSLSLPGSGRYELLLLVSPGTRISEAASVPDDATETLLEGRQLLQLRELSSGKYMVEIEADGKYQLEVSFQARDRQGVETCRTFITCDETREEGCRSEFERLIKHNRQHLERFDTKAVVQLDRHARLSSLQTWMLDEQNVAKTFLPLVIADDYAAIWAPPRLGVPPMAPSCPRLASCTIPGPNLHYSSHHLVSSRLEGRSPNGSEKVRTTSPG